MAFSPIKPGGWAFGERLTSGQMNALDADHANALDGLNGGTYTLANPLIIGGNYLGLTELRVPLIRGDVTFQDNATFDTTVFQDLAMFLQGLQISNGITVTTGTVTLSAPVTLQVDGTTRLYGATTIGDAATDFLRVYAESEFRGDVTIGVLVNNKALLIRHTTTVAGDLAVSGPLSVSGAAGFTGQVTFSAGSDPLIDAPMVISAAVEYSGIGRTLTSSIEAPNSDSTIDIRRYRHIYIPATVSASRVYSIDIAGNNDNEWFVIQNDDNNNHTISFNGGAVTASLPSGQGRKYVRVNGTWRVLQIGS